MMVCIIGMPTCDSISSGSSFSFHKGCQVVESHPYQLKM